MKNQPTQNAKTASQLIDEKIAELNDWRGAVFLKVRELVKQADPQVLEECKWRGTPVWSHDGMICTGEAYKDVVKITFAKGALLSDPSHIFNAGLDGNIRRAIDFHRTDEITEAIEKAIQSLVCAAVEVNKASRAQRK